MVAQEQRNIRAGQAIRTYRYRIDGDDEIVDVGDAWLQFARENEAEELSRDAVVGQSLWIFITDRATRHIYEAVLERVRQGPLRVSIPFRCDSPRYRRFMEMELVPAADEHVSLRGRLLKREKRDPVALLDPAVPRSEESVAICGWCKQVRLTDEEWVEVEEAVARLDLAGEEVLPALTHSICPSCRETLQSGLKTLQWQPASWS